MKKIDFHIHTIATDVDSRFEFDIAKLVEYIEGMGLDGIAITNHNEFDRVQYEAICNKLVWFQFQCGHTKSQNQINSSDFVCSSLAPGKGFEPST